MGPIKALRENIKRLPLLGPALHSCFLTAFRGEGDILAMEGRLSGYHWVRFMHTFDPQYVSGEYEREIQDQLTAVLRPNMTFFDIGAHGGFFSLIGSTLVGEGGRVISFEPHPLTAKQCRRQLQINKIKNAIVVEQAISDQCGTTTFCESKFSTMASLDRSDGPRIHVETITLDKAVETYGEPDVIKMDVERSEYRVLSGSQHLLSKVRPIFLTEVHQEFGQEFCKLIADRHGYTVTPVGRSVVCVPDNYAGRDRA